MILSGHIAAFSDNERPLGTVLTDSILLAMGVAAVSRYSGYAALRSAPEEINGDTDLSMGEWVIIRPLFLLYVERENALYLEASRGMGLDPYGRTVGEITADITAYEGELPRLAFSRMPVTI